jgi:formylglycine-generating enzyme required for sulfatase activity
LDQPGTAAGETATGPDGGVYVWVPAGELYMGADDIAPPVHRVTISKGFWLGKCTVTNAQYRKYCHKVGVTFPRDSNQGDLHPVIWVSWEEAKAYCEHYGLALPTEAQWEYAARGPSGRKFPWGNQSNDEKCCNKENRGPGGTTFPVGSFPEGASWCGALDMAGNVLEWCADWYDEKYYADSPHDDPTGPESGEYRTLRGGAWGNDARNCRSSIRGGESPTGRDDAAGFRACKTQGTPSP